MFFSLLPRLRLLAFFYFNVNVFATVLSCILNKIIYC